MERISERRRGARGAEDHFLVQKFGGSSLASAERIASVAARIAASRAEGARLVVVVSAMGKTTDQLVALAGAINGSPPPRELDVLLTAGERISTALLAMALEARGVPAVSMTGRQCGIVTDGPHTRARIVEVRPERALDELASGRVVVLAGFQGVSREGEITTLGRGGSDTTAVAVAAALGAPHCDIFSDVDGVYSSDPRLCPSARRLDRVGYETMQELARQGARVLNESAVEHARRGGVTIRARATSGSSSRTSIGAGETATGGGLHGALAVAGRKDLLRLRARDGAAAIVLRRTLDERVPLLAVSPATPGEAQVLWAVGEELTDARAFADELERDAPGSIEAEPGFGSVSLVGPGVGQVREARALLERTLRAANITPHAIAATRHSVFATVDVAAVDDAIRAVHRAAIEAPAEELGTCAS